MKTLKRWMAVALAVTLLVVSLNQGSYFSRAASEPEIYGEDMTASPGDEIKIPIMIKNNPGFTGVGFKLDYDRDVLTLKKTSKGSLLDETDTATFMYNESEVDSDKVNVLFSSPDGENLTGDGQLFTLTFQVAETAAGGTQTIKMSAPSGFNFSADLTEFNVTFTDINVTITGASGTEETQTPATTKAPAATKEPSTSTDTETVYTWAGEITGWGGPNSYPSSAGHKRDDGEDSFYYTDLTTMNFGMGYGCGLELMNPYNDVFVGGDDEMAVFIKKMVNPRIVVYLDNGGAASSWNWEEELSFESGVEYAFPDGYLDTGYFALFGNDDTIFWVDIYDAGADADKGKIPTSPTTTTTTEAPAATTEPTTEAPNVDAPATEAPAAVTSAPDSAAAGTTSAPAVTQKPTTYRINIDDDDYTKVKKPGRVTIKKIKSTGRGKVKVSWKGKCNDRYEIQYSTKKNFSGKKTKRCYSKSTTLYLKSHKKYYVRVRAVNYGHVSAYRWGYKKGNWSKVKAVRVK